MCVRACVYVCVRERECARARERDGESARGRERERDREKKKERDRDEAVTALNIRDEWFMETRKLKRAIPQRLMDHKGGWRQESRVSDGDKRVATRHKRTTQETRDKRTIQRHTNHRHKRARLSV